MNLPKKYLKKFYWRDYIAILLGVTIYAVSLTGFLTPYKIVIGGLGGVSLLIKYSTGIPIWVSYISINSLLLILAWYFLGRKYVVSTLFTSIALTVFLNFAERHITEALISNETMAILIGAIGCGVGLGMVLAANSSTGGTDIIAAIITKYRYVTMGRVLMYVDVFIILSSYFLFQSLEKIIIGFVTSAIIYYAVDMVINGSKQSVQFFIFSSKYNEIATHINSELGRGCSVIDGIGWYSQEPQKIVILMTRRNESASVFRLVHRIDADAFITQANVTGVYGKGFEAMRK